MQPKKPRTNPQQAIALFPTLQQHPKHHGPKKFPTGNCLSSPVSSFPLASHYAMPASFPFLLRFWCGCTEVNSFFPRVQKVAPYSPSWDQTPPSTAQLLYPRLKFLSLESSSPQYWIYFICWILLEAGGIYELESKASVTPLTQNC